MSLVGEVLEEEYDRSIRLSNALQKEINALPNGSLQKKNINGKEYWYLQYREGEKVKSKYIRNVDVEEIKGLKSRCITEDNENEICPVCGKKSKHIVVWGIQY